MDIYFFERYQLPFWADPIQPTTRLSTDSNFCQVSKGITGNTEKETREKRQWLRYVYLALKKIDMPECLAYVAIFGGEVYVQVGLWPGERTKEGFPVLPIENHVISLEYCLWASARPVREDMIVRCSFGKILPLTILFLDKIKAGLDELEAQKQIFSLEAVLFCKN